MNAREHYELAEKLLTEAGVYGNGSMQETSRLAKAQVHATLARAAEAPGRRPDTEWCDACDGSGYASPAPNNAGGDFSAAAWTAVA